METILESTSNLQTKISNWRNKERRCAACLEGLCNETDGSLCQKPYKCPCKCTVGSKEDTIKKVATIGGGVALFAGGTALAIMAAPVALPAVLVGGMIGSAGASAAIHGIQKSVAKEKITKPDLTINVGVGAVSGLLTAGISTGVGAVSPLLTGAATASTTTTQIGVSAGTGVLNGLTSKAVNETANVVIGEKEWSEWGQSPSGSTKETLKEWTIPLATGALGGVVGVSTDVSAKKAVEVTSLHVTKIITPETVTGVVKVGGAVLKEGANFGIKKALSEDSDDFTLVDLALATGTSAGMTAVSYTCKVEYTKLAENNYNNSIKNISKTGTGLSLPPSE